MFTAGSRPRSCAAAKIGRLLGASAVGLPPCGSDKITLAYHTPNTKIPMHVQRGAISASHVFSLSKVRDVREGKCQSYMEVAGSTDFIHGFGSSCEVEKKDDRQQGPGPRENI